MICLEQGSHQPCPQHTSFHPGLLGAIDPDQRPAAPVGGWRRFQTILLRKRGKTGEVIHKYCHKKGASDQSSTGDTN